MKLEDFKKAKESVKKIDTIKEILKDFTLGRVSDSEEFESNNSDFYLANFLQVFETKAYHSTGGGHTTLSRITIARYSDKSGPKYELSKQETIKLQEFLKEMLDNRLQSLIEAVESI